jgi:hypothetical protein
MDCGRSSAVVCSCSIRRPHYSPHPFSWPTRDSMPTRWSRRSDSLLLRRWLIVRRARPRRRWRPSSLTSRVHCSGERVCQDGNVRLCV